MIIGECMDWVTSIIESGQLGVLIPIVAIVGGITVGGLKIYFKHVERMEKIRQGIDPDTGGMTYYAKFPAGSHFDLHWHTHNEYVVVVAGKLTIVLGDQSHCLVAGSYIVIPGKMHHSWDVSSGEDAVILVRRGGPADFHFIK